MVLEELKKKEEKRRKGKKGGPAKLKTHNDCRM